MINKNSGMTRLWGLLLIVAISAISWIARPEAIEFDNELTKDLPVMFGYLVLISLFIERAIEVFLSAWRSQGADMLDYEISKNKSVIEALSDANNNAGLNKTDISDASKTLLALQEERVIYSAHSRFIAQWMGLGIGFLVSLVGVRVLGNVIDIASLSGSQQGVFTVVDILLTGAVLAGGSEAINKIMKVYNSFMIATEKKTKGQ